MEIAVPCAFQRLLDISAHVQMEWIWKTNLRVHKVKYTLAIANLTNYTFNCFEFFLSKKTVIFISIEKIWTCFFQKCVYRKINCNLKKQISFMCTWYDILNFTFYINLGDKRKPLPILRGLSYREEEVVSENNIPVQNLGGPRAVKAEDTSDATPVIAGSVLGAVVLIGIVVVLLFIYFKRRYALLLFDLPGNSMKLCHWIKPSRDCCHYIR